MGVPQLNIKDAAITQMVRELADMTGESQTEVVRKAVQQRLERERRERKPRDEHRSVELTPEQQREFERMWAKIEKIQAQITQEMIDNMLTDDDLYDEQGLPR
jgi:hypothetical protein